VKAVLVEGGVFTQEIVAEAGTHELASPGDWWSIIMGSGYRGTVEQLSQAEREYVRDMNVAFVRENGICKLETNVVYATASKEL
jgi:hypothetical protein